MTTNAGDERPTRHPDHETQDERSERWELLSHVQALMEPVMVVLGFVFLILILIEYGGLLVGTREEVWLSHSMLVIWAIFLLDFILRFAIAPEKIVFLRSNWLTLMSLAIPLLRPIRALRAIRALRSISLVRLVGAVNRGMRIIRRVSMGHQFAYLAGVTLLVVLAGAVGAWFFDRGEPNATIHSIGDALWWSSAMVTTITNEKFVVSPEARILAILMRVYAVTAFGLITATFATYLIGQRVNPAERQDVDTHSLNQQIERLHEDIIRLRQELATIREG